jgi:hypothetical protein
MTKVNGLELPPELDRAIAAGRWKLPTCSRDVEKLGIKDVSDLALLSVAAMGAETDELKSMLENGEGDFFSLVAGRKAGPKGRQLDVTKAVVIAATRAQEALCLDYSTGPTPRVVATHYEPGGVTWVEVARSVNELLRILSTEPE